VHFIDDIYAPGGTAPPPRPGADPRRGGNGPGGPTARARGRRPGRGPPGHLRDAGPDADRPPIARTAEWGEFAHATSAPFHSGAYDQ